MRDRRTSREAHRSYRTRSRVAGTIRRKLVTHGRGWYCEWEGAARELKPGDVVDIPAGVKHWHGAAKDSWFAHISIEIDPEKGPAEWLEPVAKEDYEKLP